MGEHYKYKYSITIHTDDLAVVNCLRALSKYSQKSGNYSGPHISDSSLSCAQS